METGRPPGPRPPWSWVTLCATIALLAAAGGCGNVGACSNSEDRVVSASELPCSMVDEETGLWESHPFPVIGDDGSPALEDEACRWLEFRGCSTYRFENPLDREPTLVVGYTSFEPDGQFATTGSGNSFVVDGTSESEVVIRNTQAQLFYLRLVLQ